MAVSHAAHVYNHTPNEKGMCPADIFTGSLVPRHHLLDFHTWGCPVFVLDPQLQSGQKLPRWQLRSRQGIFMGLSSIHSSEVPLVLNTATGSITPQFHVVFDDSFSTVTSLEREDDPPAFCNDLCLENTVYVPTEVTNVNGIHLADDWLTDVERTQKQRELQRREEIRLRLLPRLTPALGSTPDPAPSTPLIVEHTPVVAPVATPVAVPPPTPQSPAPEVVHAAAVRRSERSNKGQYGSTRYFDEVFLTPLDDVFQCDAQTQQLSYLAGLYTCYDTGVEDIVDPRMYAAKHCRDDPDSPTFHQAINGPDADDYIHAMSWKSTHSCNNVLGLPFLERRICMF
jgi:hypothetical protein